MLSVNPMNDSPLLLSGLVTMAWYIRPDVWQFSSTEHVSFTRQLQLHIIYCVFCVAFVGQYCFVVVRYGLFHV